MGQPDAGSGVTQVDPGQIKAFAQFLDEMTSRMHDDLKKQVDTFASSHPRIFGYYDDSSERAETKHKKMVGDASEFLNTMHERFGNIAAGTHALSKRYTDLDELNTAQGGDVTEALANGGR